jgi:Zn-dependent M32 family carboxypeptidase
MSDKSVEERLAALEAAVAELQRRLATPPAPDNWLERVSGSMKDVEGFEEMVRLGREFREAQRLPEDEEAAS